MNRRKAKRLLDLTKPLYVRRKLTTHGVTFGPREELPVKELGIRRESIESWFRLRMISHDPNGDIRVPNRLTDHHGRRNDGPTIEEWMDAGYYPEHYPPAGWTVRPSPGYDQFSKTGTLPEPWEGRIALKRKADALWADGKQDEANEIMRAFYEGMTSSEPEAVNPSDASSTEEPSPSESSVDETPEPGDSEGTAEASDEDVEEPSEPSEEATEAPTPAPEPTSGRRRGGKRGS